MYPFLTLNDDTEIVHSEILEGDRVKVYIEKPSIGGFHHATCWLPEYKWEDIVGFGTDEMKQYEKIVESAAHLIILFAGEGGFNNAASI